MYSYTIIYMISTLFSLGSVICFITGSVLWSDCIYECDDTPYITVEIVGFVLLFIGIVLICVARANRAKHFRAHLPPVVQVQYPAMPQQNYAFATTTATGYQYPPQGQGAYPYQTQFEQQPGNYQYPPGVQPAGFQPPPAYYSNSDNKV